jgi:hypothetical protein
MSPDVAAGLQFDLNRPLDYPSVPPSLLASIKETYCRHLYSLLVALGQPANQATAQWVANVCDFRDPDSTLTRFRYDTNPADGWNVADSTEVFGCERPEVVITETIAWDDKLSIVLLHPWDAKLVDNQTVDDQTQFDLTEAIDPALGLVSATAAKRNVVDLGRRVERGIHVARVVRSAIEVPQGAWEAGLRLALELCDSTISYRTRYLAALLDAPVLDLVLRDASNPQSLAFQIDGVRAHLAALPRTAGAPSGDDLVAVLRDMSAIVDTLGGAGKAGRSGAIDALRHAALAVEARLMTLSDDLNGAFFAHVAAARIVGAE